MHNYSQATAQRTLPRLGVRRIASGHFSTVAPTQSLRRRTTRTLALSLSGTASVTVSTSWNGPVSCIRLASLNTSVCHLALSFVIWMSSGNAVYLALNFNIGCWHFEYVPLERADYRNRLYRKYRRCCRGKEGIQRSGYWIERGILSWRQRQTGEEGWNGLFLSELGLYFTFKSTSS